MDPLFPQTPAHLSRRLLLLELYNRVSCPLLEVAAISSHRLLYLNSFEECISVSFFQTQVFDVLLGDVYVFREVCNVYAILIHSGIRIFLETVGFRHVLQWMLYLCHFRCKINCVFNRSIIYFKILNLNRLTKFISINVWYKSILSLANHFITISMI